MDKSIFISKDRKEVDELANFLEADKIQLIPHSFLKFQANKFSIPTSFDIVFFGSPRAVSYFLASSKIQENIKIACVGNGTAKAVIEKGYTPDFIGDDSNISNVATDFKNWCGKQIVLFPVSTISLKTVSQLFNENQKIELIVYNTSIEPAHIKACSTYVFTSPSNVAGFFIQNTLPMDAQIISWGKSTEGSLNERGVKSDVLNEPTIDSLISLLQE